MACIWTARAGCLRIGVTIIYFKVSRWLASFVLLGTCLEGVSVALKHLTRFFVPGLELFGTPTGWLQEPQKYSMRPSKLQSDQDVHLRCT